MLTTANSTQITGKMPVIVTKPELKAVNSNKGGEIP
jgi:hypothetical protein